MITKLLIKVFKHSILKLSIFGFLQLQWLLPHCCWKNWKLKIELIGLNKTKLLLVTATATTLLPTLITASIVESPFRKLNAKYAEKWWQQKELLHYLCHELMYLSLRWGSNSSTSTSAIVCQWGFGEFRF